MASTLIEVRGLRKVYRIGFWMRQVEAVRNVSFAVRSGDIFGFLGPNGAGKTTTIKMLTGLIAPTSGEATIFGDPIPSPHAMKRVGFMPENPYVYPYLTPREFVEMCGRLSGLGGAAVRSRARHVLDQVGIAYAAERPVQRLSKGMLQRTGLAAALVADPELLILDEPMSGLDPVGRKEIKDLIVHERKNGRTIFFSTHILADAEELCDQVLILRKGEVVVSGQLRELLRSDVKRTDISVLDASTDFEAWCKEQGYRTGQVGSRFTIEVEGAHKVAPVLRHCLDHDLTVVEVIPRHETLEDLFVREAIGVQPSAAVGASG